MINLALYGSHNAALAVEIDGKVVLVTELERIVNEKNQGLSQYKTFKADDILFYSKFLLKSSLMIFCLDTRILKV